MWRVEERRRGLARAWGRVELVEEEEDGEEVENEEKVRK